MDRVRDRVVKRGEREGRGGGIKIQLHIKKKKDISFIHSI